MQPDSTLELMVTLLIGVIGSSVLAAVVKNSQLQSSKHRELVAAASKSVYMRVEMYYRIRRRTKDAADVIAIRNAFHQIQEENEYYRALLATESKWHGERYGLYIKAIKKLTEQQTQDAWKQRPFGPDAQIKSENRPNHQRINELSMQFAKDSRRLMNPVMRPWMRIRDSWVVTRLWKIRVYEP
jgi:hypothetical protein